MFGLMQEKSCSMTADKKRQRRLNYCGTCKTIARMYGWKARLLLNTDTVFLAELLGALHPDVNLQQNWQDSYLSLNCFALPPKEKQLPLPLQYAAAITVVLAEQQLLDNIADSGRFLHKIVHRVLQKKFNKATLQLRTWGFPYKEMLAALNIQRQLEAESRQKAKTTTLDIFASPTANITSLVFRHGTRLVGRFEIEEEMAKLGSQFGNIVYLLDALIDFQKDVKTGEFNAIQRVYTIGRERDVLPAAIREAVLQKIRRLEGQFHECLCHLPIAVSEKEIFYQRLERNVERKFRRLAPRATDSMQKNPGVRQPGERLPSTHLNFAKRWRSAQAYCKRLISKSPKGTASELLSVGKRKLKTTVVYASALPMAFVAPELAFEAESYGGCMSLLFNVSFIAAALGFMAMLTMYPIGLLGRLSARLIHGPILAIAMESGGIPGGGHKKPLKHNESESNSGCDCCSGSDCCCGCEECGQCGGTFCGEGCGSLECCSNIDCCSGCDGCSGCDC